MNVFHGNPFQKVKHKGKKGKSRNAKGEVQRNGNDRQCANAGARREGGTEEEEEGSAYCEQVLRFWNFPIWYPDLPCIQPLTIWNR